VRYRTQTSHIKAYAFLVDTWGIPVYQIVLMRDKEDNQTLVSWTSSTLIRAGTAINQLEVRDEGSQLLFYINGQYVTSVTDTANYADGVVGFYVGGKGQLATFDDLEIYR